MPSMARFGTIILAIRQPWLRQHATKDQNKRWPMSPRMLDALCGGAGLPVTVMHKAPEPMQAGHMPAEEAKAPMRGRAESTEGLLGKAFRQSSCSGRSHYLIAEDWSTSMILQNCFLKNGGGRISRQYPVTDL